MRSWPDAPLSRRRLLAVLTLSSPFLVARRRRGLEAARRIDGATLTAVAETVLPSAIGGSGLAAAVAGFERWLTGYRGGAELLHGYGASEVRFAPPSPAPRFVADLRGLERSAQARHGRSFGTLDLAARRALVESAISRFTDRSLPPPAGARHVAIALLAHWAESPAGFNAGYAARIDRFGCRPLAANPDRPARLETTP
jgi:hypothetical protein